MSGLTLNKPMIDYLTMTSFEDEIYLVAKGIVEELELVDEMKDYRFLQYSGHSLDLRRGNMQFMTGVQKLSYHNMVRVSGEACMDALPRFASVFMPYRDNLTRIDAQVTILEPDNWSQWELLTDLRKRGHHVGWVASRDRDTGFELATVYIGSREHSPRFVRIYQKLTADGQKLLRLEVEIKRDRAREHGKYLVEYASGDLSKIRDELGFLSQYHPGLEYTFSASLEGWLKPVRVQRKETSTERWIFDQCLPAIAKYCNEHNSDQTAQMCMVMCAIIESTRR